MTTLPQQPTTDTPRPAAAELPRLERVGAHTRLLVDGSPYLAIGGELHNSTASDPVYLDRACAKLAESRVTTIVAPVSWAEIEPEEARFDFSSVAHLLSVARRYRMRVVLLWFGAYKNARSTYAPTWVRADDSRFPRAAAGPSEMRSPFTYAGSMPKPELSVFAPELRRSDSAAYRVLMEYLRREDPEHTVVMVQVENEVGMLGSGRDHSPSAQAVWNARVPADVVSLVRSHPEFSDSWLRDRIEERTGTWSEVFGEDNRADELFMSWGFAGYVENVARAGKDVLALPTLVNAWLGPQPGQHLAGQYPSGGPTSAMIPVWEAFAPSIDIVAPDIYVDDSEAAMRTYARDGRALFIPEARFRVADLFRAIGRYNAIGYCVFGAEDARPGNQCFTAAGLIESQKDAIVAAQADGAIRSVLVEGDESQVARIGPYTLTIHDTRALFARILVDAGVAAPTAGEPREPESIAGPFGPDLAEERAFGAVARIGEDEFLLLGSGFTVDFSHDSDDVELDHVRELRCEGASWVDGRVLNGDEHMHLVPGDRIGGSRVRLLRRAA